MSTKSLIKPIGTNSLGIATSRILGFARDILIAGFFGTGNLIQAFIVAFRIPNLLRQIVGEGATNAAFVPVLSEYLSLKKKEEYWRLAGIIFNVLIVTLLVVVAIGILIAPIAVRIIAPGFVKDSHQLELAIKLTRMIFPYILLIGLTALAAGILNSLKHFTVPAFSPCLLNISIITAILLFKRDVSPNILAGAVLIGGLLQLLVYIPVLYKKGMRLSFPPVFHHPAAKKITRLLIPRAFGSVIYQFNTIVDTMLASLHVIVGAGGIAALWYSYRLIQFPTAIFGHAVATGTLPTLSGQFSRNETDNFKKTVSFSLKSVFLFMVPATVGFMLIGKMILRILFSEIAKTLFQANQFGPYSIMITNHALFFYSIGLFSYAGIRVLAFSFYSMQDTMTPVKTAGAALVINIVLNLILMHPLKIGGLALATSIAGIFNFVMLFYILRKRIGPLNEKEMLRFLIKVVVASLAMGGVLFWALNCPICISVFVGKGLFMDIAGLLLLVITGILVYIGVLMLLKVDELKKVFKWIKRS